MQAFFYWKRVGNSKPLKKVTAGGRRRGCGCLGGDVSQIFFNKMWLPKRKKTQQYVNSAFYAYWDHASFKGIWKLLVTY